jgi:hypothetical protein
LIPHPEYSFLGASPDGIRPDGVMIEIKCPFSRIPTGIPELKYWIQMQIQMECCDMEECDFLDVKIAEYGSEELYLSDAMSIDDENYCYNRTANGMAKGMLIERVIVDDKGDNKSKYYYPPVMTFKNRKEEEEWLDNLIKTEIVDKMDGWTFNERKRFFFGESKFLIRYWKVEIWNDVQRIQRNREWFNQRIVDAKNFWDTVLYYRQNPDKVPAKITRQNSLTSSSSSSSSPPSRQTSIMEFSDVAAAAPTTYQPRRSDSVGGTIGDTPTTRTSTDCLFVGLETGTEDWDC